ncbi:MULTISPECIES: DUF5825 family protein [unclassified Streptomyces]|uniref:DUF5825 family protein n=1 Tax=unclassified Streptomyces TaxID=2593676 RepID=UPI00136ABA43|nr:MULTISPECIES: DUF5825 family protein [unclassified Streptomyces]MYY80059.1 hypothetical protein [Streptomyces sp. SID335]MYZ18433.1 hypothetical protein [Streptomyces sp. SID337]NDZ88616.1 hypothetical protein [Streptomyces sp. SID10115]NEB44084.1 hypothetical protein [Streptomyces sp. SID339]
MTATLATPTLLAWRDYDPAACALPGMFLGEVPLPGPPSGQAERLWQLGARRVRLPDPVDLTATADPAAALHGLGLVRDLTARAVMVEWKLRLDPDSGDRWRMLSHLQPPATLLGPDGAEDALNTWRRGHYLCKCLWRRGPGFIQIRDRRWGELRRFTADEPEYATTIDRLDHGALADTVPKAVLDDFRAEQLVLDIGPYAWWLPYRVSRWLQQSIAI